MGKKMFWMDQNGIGHHESVDPNGMFGEGKWDTVKIGTTEFAIQKLIPVVASPQNFNSINDYRQRGEQLKLFTQQVSIINNHAELQQIYHNQANDLDRRYIVSQRIQNFNKEQAATAAKQASAIHHLFYNAKTGKTEVKAGNAPQSTKERPIESMPIRQGKTDHTVYFNTADKPDFLRKYYADISPSVSEASRRWIINTYGPKPSNNNSSSSSSSSASALPVPPKVEPVHIPLSVPVNIITPLSDTEMHARAVLEAGKKQGVPAALPRGHQEASSAIIPQANAAAQQRAPVPEDSKKKPSSTINP